ncbi:Sb-PDE family phosphodiesterase [Opitutaceae bacterium]|nr:Sb-PDE family phosphodiesterase [Opitutaceae bacterium]
MIDTPSTLLAPTHSHHLITAGLTLSLLAASFAGAHGMAKHKPEPGDERPIEFPDTAEHFTLTLDPHTHSVFSDGHVWPTVRVEEALRDGLDSLAITEHLEYQPHRADLPHPDRNRASEEAIAAARNTDLIVIHGSEITRSQPVGHLNALFLSDSNALLNRPRDIPPGEPGYDQAVNNWPGSDALAAAAEQRSFVFLNHLDWTSQQPDGIARLTDFHLEQINLDHIHGIEVMNTFNYSEDSFAIALEHNLTVMGSSDIHGLIDWDYTPHKGGHRPVTLVFAQERSSEGIREALFAGRTAAWLGNLLVGREEHVRPLLEASISIESAFYLKNTTVLELKVRNDSDATFQLQNDSDYTFTRFGELIPLAPHETTIVQVRTVDRLEHFDIPFHLSNVLIAPKKHPSFSLSGEVGPHPKDK